MDARAVQGDGSTRIPLSVKLVATTALLLAAITAAAVFFSRGAVERLAEQYAHGRRAAGESDIRRQAEVIVRSVAMVAGVQLADMNFTYMQNLVDTTVAGDDRVLWMAIAFTDNGRVAVASRGAPEVAVDDELGRELARAGGAAPVSRRDPADPSTILFGANILAAGRPFAQLRLALSTRQLDEELAAAVDAGRQQARAAQRDLVWAGAAALLVGLLLALVQAYRMTRPLGQLSQQASHIARGQLHHRVEVASRDEVGQLARDFNHMAERLGVLLKETADKASLERELSLARDVQMAMHPGGDVFGHAGIRVAGYLESASECGGDWWTARKLPGKRLLVVIGDVTGHGLPAAIITASARGAVEALDPERRELTPDEVLDAIDKAVSNVGKHALYMTCFAAILDTREGLVRYANAGHTFPYVVRSDGGRAQLDSLASAGNPLGMADRRAFRTREHPLRPGDVIVFYTDGLVERASDGGRRFGEKRLRAILSRAPIDTTDKALLELRDGLLSELEAFARDQPPADDITVVLCQYQMSQESRKVVVEQTDARS